jgi:methylated-DNA-[protein]-cysteine S-methyltransferase
MEGIPPFNRRVYEFVRTIPRGETRSQDEVARVLRVPGAVYSMTQAIGKNPFMIIVPCHRVTMEGGQAERTSPNAGAISRRHLLSIEGNRPAVGRTLFDALLPVGPPRSAH